jgi:acetyl-CoA carboxylase biotin carboxyl carrier protein
MDQKELKELIEFLIDKDIAEFELERGDLKMRMKRRAEPQILAAPVAPAAAYTPASNPAHTMTPASPGTGFAGSAGTSGIEAAAEAEDEAGLHVVRSPIVGTFYESPSPGAPGFVKIGDVVSEGQVLGIVEAMKLMNEIESDAAGEIVKVYVHNAQPVEYGQPLYGIRAR